MICILLYPHKYLSSTNHRRVFYFSQSHDSISELTCDIWHWADDVHSSTQVLCSHTQLPPHMAASLHEEEHTPSTHALLWQLELSAHWEVHRPPTQVC